MATTYPMRQLQRGLSLIDILVGVAIGLIGIVIMFQVFENWGERARTTGAGSDAQIAGSTGFYRLEQDIKQAGFGFGAAGTYLGCTVDAYDSRLPTGTTYFQFQLVPVLITDGAAGAPDSVTLLYGTSSLVSKGIPFNASTATTKSTVDINARIGVSRGDKVIVAAPSPITGGSNVCGLIEITDSDSNADGVTIGHGAALTYNLPSTATTAVTTTSTFNPQAPVTANTFFDKQSWNTPPGNPPLVTTARTGMLFPLGASPRRNTWQISNNQLFATVDLNGPTTSSEVADNIINLQAQYGIDADGNNIVDCWTENLPTTVNSTTCPSLTSRPGTLPAIGWNDVRAVRIALLARNQNYEKPTTAGGRVTPNAPTWAGGAFTMNNLTASGSDIDDWRNYRYRVYESTIPLRNMIWGTAP